MPTLSNVNQVRIAKVVITAIVGTCVYLLGASDPAVVGWWRHFLQIVLIFANAAALQIPNSNQVSEPIGPPPPWLPKRG